MLQLPLVTIELQRVMAGFRETAREIGAGRRAVTGADPGTLGAQTVGAAVEAGLRDLASALDRLESTAAACVVALGHHDEGDLP